MILHKKSTPYHPQANGQAESSNKVLMRILKKIVSKNKSDCDDKLDSALWAFRKTFKVATGMTPFRLVFGIEAVVQMEYVIPSLRLSIQHRMSPEESISHKQKEFLKLEEDRIQSAYLVDVGQRRQQAWMSSCGANGICNSKLEVVNSAEESISHRQKELLKLEEDRIQSAYLVDVGQRRQQAWMSSSHRQKELLKLEEDRIQSAYLVDVGQRRQQAWMSRQVKFKIFEIVSEQGQGTFLLQDVFETKVIKPVNGFGLKTFYGKVPEVPKWMVNKAEESSSKRVTVSVLGVAVEFSKIVLVEFFEGTGIQNLDNGMAVKNWTPKTEVRIEECWRNGTGEKGQGVYISGVMPTASGLKTPAVDTLMEEGTVSGSKRQKLLWGSPTIDVKSPFKVSWKNFEEPDSKVIFFSMGSKFKKSNSKGKKITLFPTGIVGSTGKNVPESLLAKEGSSASHGAKGIFSVEEATSWLTNLGKFMTTENVLLINRLSPLAEVEKAVLQGQGMIGVLVADFDADA
ncbi:hypothetical protein L7F22_030272 [Adiantum nelumboides]|nr:hypothetical protein [Adiantum nelumboides]